MKQKTNNFIKEYYPILIFILVFLIERFWLFNYLGYDYNLGSDDISYIKSGIVFYESGQITMHDGLSAQIMPGMPVFISIFVHFFGKGETLMLALKIAWILMGSLVLLFVYMTLRQFTNRLFSLLPNLFFLLPDFAWMDQLILTETPFLLCLVIMIYGTIMMGQTEKNKYYIIVLLSYFGALMLKANIGVYPVFAGLYLLMKDYPFKKLLGQGVVAGLCLLAFIIPWSYRNYQIFDEFIPLTYGAGNPELLGTYQGLGYPHDEDLDYSVIDEKASKRYNKYFDENYEAPPHILRYVRLGRDGLLADYRKAVWWDTYPRSMLYSYFYLKPKDMILDQSFLWPDYIPDFDYDLYELCIDSRKLDLIVVVIGIILACFMNRYYEEMTFLTLLYLFNIYLYAMTFSFSRYSQPLLAIRYIAFGLSLDLIYRLFKNIKDRVVGK